MHKASLSEGNSILDIPTLFQGEMITKAYLGFLFVCFCGVNRPTREFFTHLWVKEIQFGLNEGPLPFTRGDNHEIAKIH